MDRMDHELEPEKRKYWTLKFGQKLIVEPKIDNLRNQKFDKIECSKN